MWVDVAFANAKATHIFSATIIVYMSFNDKSFNDMLTNDIIYSHLFWTTGPCLANKQLIFKQHIT